MRQSLRSWRGLSAVLPIAVILHSVVYLGRVKGRSMQPTLNPDENRRVEDVVLLDKLSPKMGRISKGDIVLLTLPCDPELSAIKRITAEEGEVVFLRHFKASSCTNTELTSLDTEKSNLQAASWGFSRPNAIPTAMQEVSGDSLQSGEMQGIVVPKGHVWVEADEPFHGLDSNEWGPISKSLITAKVSWIVWPPSRFGIYPSERPNY